MADDDEVGLAIRRYLSWLETWRQGRGLYGGLHVHSCWGVATVIGRRYQGVTVSDYFGLVRGFVELYRKTGDEAFLLKCLDMGDALVSLQGADGCFEHSVYENEPGRGGCIHNAVADVALLTLSSLLADEGLDPKPYLEAVRRNLDWIMGCWWMRGNAWLRSPDFPCWCGVTNQDLAVCWAMAMFADLEDPSYWERYGREVADWYLEHYFLPDLGAYVRGDAPDFLEPAVYNGLIDYELVGLYECTGDADYLRVAARNVEYLAENSWRDECGCLRIHNNVDLKTGAVAKRPSVITQGPLLSALRALEELGVGRFKWLREELLRTTLFYQSGRGYFRNSTDHSNLFDIVPGLRSSVLEALAVNWSGGELPELGELPDLSVDASGDAAWLDADEWWQLRVGREVVSGVKRDPWGIEPRPAVEGLDARLEGERLRLELPPSGPELVSVDWVMREGASLVVRASSRVRVVLKLRSGRRAVIEVGEGVSEVRYDDL